MEPFHFPPIKRIPLSMGQGSAQDFATVFFLFLFVSGRLSIFFIKTHVVTKSILVDIINHNPILS
jgi:hypothetical protein